MPLYDFNCDEGCGPFESVVSADDIGTVPVSCPSCGKASRRIFTVPNMNCTRAEADALRDSMETFAGKQQEMLGTHVDVVQRIKEHANKLEKMRQENRRAARENKANLGKPMFKHQVSIPLEVHATKLREHGEDYYRGEEGVKRAIKEGFGVQ